MDIKLPRLGEGAESGTVVSIFVKPGDQVKEGQTILELENEKAVAPIPASASGRVAKLYVKEGDKLFPIEQPGGGLILTPHDPDFEKAMEVARRGMKRYHNALAELAK